uniref:Uncharacterized protein n=1 Tax=Tetraselmis chuii TaxID=63592 RepID=A0A7S1SZ27_9CHLO
MHCTKHVVRHNTYHQHRPQGGFEIFQSKPCHFQTLPYLIALPQFSTFSSSVMKFKLLLPVVFRIVRLETCSCFQLLFYYWCCLLVPASLLRSSSRVAKRPGWNKKWLLCCWTKSGSIFSCERLRS